MSQLRILVVEDDIQFNAFIKEVLESEGYQVSASFDGADASSIINDDEQSFDLLITDLLIPKKDGIRLITETRVSHPQLPIVAMSGGISEHSPVFLKAASTLGATSVLEKPFTIEQLLTVVKQCFK